MDWDAFDENRDTRSFSSMKQSLLLRRPSASWLLSCCCQCQIPKTSNIFDYFVIRHSCLGDTNNPNETIFQSKLQDTLFRCAMCVHFSLLAHSMSHTAPAHTHTHTNDRIDIRKDIEKLSLSNAFRVEKWTEQFSTRKKGFFHGHFYKINYTIHFNHTKKNSSGILSQFHWKIH